MISNQEKGEKLNSVIERLSENQNIDKAALDLHKLLLADCGGILYKYMPFREYTVSTIKDATLYFSSPTAFNDPFDCKIGIDYQSLIEAMYLKEFDKIDAYLKEYLDLRNGVKTLEDMSEEVLPVIAIWDKSEKIETFIAAFSGITSQEEVNAYLLDNFDVVSEIVESLLCMVADTKGMPITSSIFPNIVNNMTDDGKLHLIESTGTYADYVKSLGVDDVDADEIDLTERACQIIQPDRKEAINQSREMINALEQRLNDTLYTLFKVCCLCTSSKNRLMWSHYADSHKGICIEYDFSEYIENGSQPMPVYYSKTRPKFPWNVAIEQTPETQSKATAHFMKALLTKDESWSYENEWRLLIQVNSGVDKIPAPPIKCIYLGALCSQENAEKVISAAREKNIPVKKMTVDRGEYNLHASEVII